MVRSNNDNDLTKQDLEKTLEAHAKTIELQILVSQQQNELIEQITFCQEKLKEIDAHFSNGFRSDIKTHMSQEVRDVKSTLGEIKAKLEKTEENAVDRCRSCSDVFVNGITGHDDNNESSLKNVLEIVKATQEQIEEIDRRSWQQMWIWGGIAVFTLVNAVILVVGLWQNAWIIKS